MWTDLCSVTPNERYPDTSGLILVISSVNGSSLSSGRFVKAMACEVHLNDIKIMVVGLLLVGIICKQFNCIYVETPMADSFCASESGNK